MSGYFINSGVLFGVAKQAAKSAGNGESVSQNALVAVVFSVVGAEAFINEATELAADIDLGKESEPRKVTAFAEMVRQAEEAHAPLELKYQIAKWVFSGEVPNKGATPYQDFHLLIAVRNALIHYKLLDKLKHSPESGLTMDPPKVLERLRSKNVLVQIPEGINASWLHRIGTTEMARWACNAVSAAIKEIVASIPSGFFKIQMGLLARGFDLEEQPERKPGEAVNSAEKKEHA